MIKKRNLILAPNSFKKNLNSTDIVNYIASGLEQYKFILDKWNIIKKPLSDGGDGSIQAMKFYSKGKSVFYKTVNPLGDPIKSESFWLEDKESVFIEMSSTSGLQVCKRLNPLEASSYGTGIIIKKAIKDGAKTIYLCIGGTATTDLGFGLMSALGVKFYNRNGDNIIVNSGNIDTITDISVSDAKIFLDKHNAKIISLCDCRSSLDGIDGCWERSIQKGATEEQKNILKENVLYIMDKIYSDFNKDLSNKEMMGCGGGSAGGLWALLDSKLVLGAQYFIDISNLQKDVNEDTVVITGEGIVDYVTFEGKLPYVLLQNTIGKCKKNFLMVGELQYNYKKLIEKGFDCVISTDPRNRNFKEIEANFLMPEILSDFSTNLAAILDI